MYYDDTVILLFAKAPVAGEVNTRLIPDIGVQTATRLQYDLIHHRLAMLAEAELCDVRLMCAPSQQDKDFLLCRDQYPITLMDQTGDDLGERMFNGVAAALKQYKHCIVIGTDAPELNEVRIKQVIENLHDGIDVVIVPAEDGGYVLIAMQHAYRFLFQGMSWGSADVMQQTRSRLNENNISFEELASSWDIDRIEDYQRYLKFIA